MGIHDRRFFTIQLYLNTEVQEKPFRNRKTVGERQQEALGLRYRNRALFQPTVERVSRTKKY